MGPISAPEFAMPEDQSHSAPDMSRIPDLPYARTLVGQPALVTGASSGIGRACAIGLAKAGARVAINYIGPADDANDVVKEITDFGGEAIALEADVSDETQVKEMFAKALQHFGTLHIVVTNAGLQSDAPLLEMTRAKWDKVIGVNLTGEFMCAREAVRIFKERGVQRDVSVAAGKLICMSSVHQKIPWAGHVNYASSKGGIMMMMQSIAQEVAPWRIRVNAIAPGAIRTSINTAAWSTPEAYADLMKLVPYQRIGEPDDIARAAAWLASDASDYVTGTTLFVDGGMTLYPGFATGG
jgi:glucose 1-dehydrogenase